MIYFPNAKINLGLNVVAKRDDGFHDIESVFYPIPWQDILEVIPQKSGKGSVVFTSSGIEIPSDGNRNLCERVYQLMHDEFDLGSVKIHLHKIIPIGAGLGGGSADAAFVVTALNQLFELNLSTEKLEEIVSKVGSDCPFFVRNKPAFVEGRGEVLNPIEIDLSGFWIMLINPNIHIGTKEAYAGMKPMQPKFALKESLLEDVSSWKETVSNDFERSVIPAYPVLSHIKDELYGAGAVYASMTGSGSTMFGLFDEEPTWNGNNNFQVKIARL